MQKTSSKTNPSTKTKHADKQIALLTEAEMDLWAFKNSACLGIDEHNNWREEKMYKGSCNMCLLRQLIQAPEGGFQSHF